MINIGDKFQKWTVLARSVNSKHGAKRYVVLCDCGTESIILKNSIVSGTSKGCINCKRSNATHDKSYHPLYHIWAGIKDRCLNITNQSYKYYGGRGITVCERWMSIDNFIEDMHPRPTPEHSIDRIDNNGNYEPTNCRWATDKEQANNKRKRFKKPVVKPTSTYTSWARMKKNGNHCHNWNSFKIFVDEMGLKPFRHKLVLIDKNGIFEKINCEWNPSKRHARTIFSLKKL